MNKTLTMAALIASLCAIAWIYFATTSQPLTNATKPLESPKIESVGYEVITPKSIIVYKNAAKSKLKLPVATQHDDSAHVVDAVVIEPSDHATTETTIFHADTGQFETVIIEEPKPWVAESRHGQIRFDYDLANSSRKAKRITVEQELFTVKDLHFGMSGALDDAMQGRLSVGVAYRW